MGDFYTFGNKSRFAKYEIQVSVIFFYLRYVLIINSIHEFLIRKFFNQLTK